MRLVKLGTIPTPLGLPYIMAERGKGRNYMSTKATIKDQQLTPRQAMFAKEYLKNGGDATKAAAKVFNTKKRTSISAMGWRYLHDPNVQRVLLETAQKLGITDEGIMLPVAKALQAKDKEGNDDLDTQLKGHDRMMRLLLAGKENGLQLNIDKVQGLNITFTDYRKAEVINGKEAESLEGNDEEDASLRNQAGSVRD